MSQLNPELLFNDNYKPYLPTLPCSQIALMCAAEDMVVPLTVQPPKVDKVGYCRLQDMNQVIRKVFPQARFIYVNRAFRNTLSHLIAGHQGIKMIICVQGHFIYFNGSDYYSYFNNDNDTVIAIWMLSPYKGGSHQ